jgi:hypothetical protein
MIVRHESQHNETMLQTSRLMKGDGYRPDACMKLPFGEPPGWEIVHIVGGSFVTWTNDRVRALDDERPAMGWRPRASA